MKSRDIARVASVTGWLAGMALVLSGVPVILAYAVFAAAVAAAATAARRGASPPPALKAARQAKVGRTEKGTAVERA